MLKRDRCVNLFVFVFLSGTLEVSPSNGTAIDTVFTFRVVENFNDDADDYPLKYKFGFYVIEDGKEVKRYLGFKNVLNRKRAKLPKGLFDRQSSNAIFLCSGTMTKVTSILSKLFTYVLEETKKFVSICKRASQ